MALKLPTRLLMLVLAACCTGLAPSPTTSDTDFTVDRPRNGETVGTESVEVSGTASAGAEIIRAISFRPDEMHLRPRATLALSVL